MEVVRLFPRIFNEEVNVGLKAVVSKEELKEVLVAFKKFKIPLPIG